MAEVLDVECKDCGDNYIVLTREVRVVNESGKHGKVGATGIAKGEGESQQKEVEYTKKEVVMCNCCSCSIRSDFYVETEDGEKYPRVG